ncbi:uncharacterized [Tachysurus ichikawai]
MRGKQLDPPCYSFCLSLTPQENSVSHKSPSVTPIISCVWEADLSERKLLDTPGQKLIDLEKTWQWAMMLFTTTGRTMAGAGALMAYDYCMKRKDTELICIYQG